MAVSGNQSAYDFFASQMKNRLGLVPGAGNLTTYANGVDGVTAAAAYNSRVLNTQLNGAGPAMSPINAPWSFSDFITGMKSLTNKQSSTTVVGTKRGRFF
jgi:hypothetical protein